MANQMNVSRDAVGALMAGLNALRYEGEQALIVSVGVMEPDIDCPDGYCQATVIMGQSRATSHAEHLADAIFLARAKARGMEEARKKAEAEKRAKAKADGSDNPELASAW